MSKQLLEPIHQKINEFKLFVRSICAGSALSIDILLPLVNVEAEVRADRRVHTHALEIFVARETMNSYLAQFVFVIVAAAGYFLGSPSILIVGIAHVLVDQLVRHNLGRFSESLRKGEIDQRQLDRIEHIFYAVGIVWAMPTWPLAESLDGLRLLLTVVSAAGLLVMANTTCFAPRVFRASVIGFALGMFAVIPVIKTMPWYVLGGAVAALIVVVTTVGAGTARQLIQMLSIQLQRDEAIAEQKSTIAELDRARRAAMAMAATDSLTGLANRFSFMTKLETLIAGGTRFSITLLDIDLFKNVNDALGHNTGDEVLKVVGLSLGSLGEDAFFAARLGGDEFALIGYRDRSEVRGARVFSQIKSKINGPSQANLDLPRILITGGSAYFPEDAANGTDLLAAADIAQREAKKTRRGTHVDYDAGLSNIFRREADIARAIDQAIRFRELFLCFQPKVDLRTGRVESAEALSRFSGERMAGYSLDEIFDVAEKRGLGAHLDELVLDRYREALVVLRDTHSISMPTSVNLSGAILKVPERLLAKLNLLIADGLSPELIRLEITENAIFGRGEISVIETLRGIVDLGFSLALDDFGTGSGSLRNLASLPINEIKIDRSFVSDMLVDAKSAAIVRGLITIGREMAIDIVAEGVETLPQAEFLRSLGAGFGQGFLWSRAIALPQFVEFVRLFGSAAEHRTPSHGLPVAWTEEKAMGSI